MHRRRFILSLLFLLALSAALTVAALAVVVDHEVDLARVAAKARIGALEASLADNIRRADYLRIQQLLNALIERPVEGVALRLEAGANPVIRAGRAWPAGQQGQPLVRYELRDGAGALLGVLTVACRWQAVALATLARMAPMIVALSAIIAAVVVLAQLPAWLHSRRMVKLLRTLAAYDGAPAAREALTRLEGASGDRGIRLLVASIRGLIDRQREQARREQETRVMCAIGAMASQVAHDMRSPLSVLRAFAQHGAAAAGPVDARLCRQAAERSVEKLVAMADEMLDYARASRIQAGDVELSRYFEEQVLPEIQRAASERRVHLSLDLPARAVARIDGAKIGRAIVNVLHNAIQSIDHDAGEVRLRAETRGADLSIGVRDNGRGIPAEQVGQLFERFNSRGKQGGTGLGLSYCKQVVDAHGGTIGVESAPGRGTEILICIPNCVVG